MQMNVLHVMTLICYLNFHLHTHTATIYSWSTGKWLANFNHQS